jgi:hypothetical protein
MTARRHTVCGAGGPLRELSQDRRLLAGPLPAIRRPFDVGHRLESVRFTARNRRWSYPLLLIGRIQRRALKDRSRFLRASTSPGSTPVRLSGSLAVPELRNVV